MVLQSLDDVVHQHLMVSTRADKSPGSKIVVANGGNGAKAEKKRRESEDSIMPLPRRSSARIQALQKAEELFARKRVEGVEEKDNCDDNLTPEKVKVKKRNRKSSGSEESVVVEVEFVSPAKKKRVAYRKCKVVGEMNGNGKGEELSGNGKVRKVNAKEELENAGGGLGEKSDLLKVKETIRLFTKHYLQLVQVSMFCVQHKILYY